LHGIQIDPTPLKLSLIEASHGKIGGVIEQVLMFCLQFDPHKNKYTIYAWNIMRLGGLFMVLLLMAVLGPVWWREQMKTKS
jgi:protein SCO1/2